MEQMRNNYEEKLDGERAAHGECNEIPKRERRH